MAERVPDSAFGIYVALGRDRSYQAVADRLGVAKRSIVRVANRENWQERVEEIDRAVRDQAEARTVETMSDLAERHVKVLHVLQARGLETLKSDRIPPAQAARVVLAALREEREVRSLPVGNQVEEEARDMAALIRQFVAEAEARTFGDFAEFDEDASAEDSDETDPGPRLA